jgi:hypothetical protein
VRLYLDECIDWRLARDIIGHDVRAARDMGWSGLKNGELLLRVQAEFDAFVRLIATLLFSRTSRRAHWRSSYFARARTDSAICVP